MLPASQREWLTSQAEKFAQNPPVEWLSARGISEEVARTNLLGLCEHPEPAHRKYEGRLSIPYRTPSGVVAIRFRCLEDHNCKDQGKYHHKYADVAGAKTYLYNVWALHERHPAIAICEGELDAVIADQVIPTVAVSGATKWAKPWRRLFEDYERVFVIGDGDKSGGEFAEKVAKQLDNAHVVSMPDGQDVNSFYVEHGHEALEALIVGRTGG